MSKKSDRHVVPSHDGGWDVVAPGAQRASSHHDTQQAAIDHAREIVLTNGAWSGDGVPRASATSGPPSRLVRHPWRRPPLAHGRGHRAVLFLHATSRRGSVRMDSSVSLPWYT